MLRSFCFFELGGKMTDIPVLSRLQVSKTTRTSLLCRSISDLAYKLVMASPNASSKESTQRVFCHTLAFAS